MTNQEAQVLAVEHWNNFTGPLVKFMLDLAKIDDPDTNSALYIAIKHLCITHFVHGVKHERQSVKN